MTQTTTPIARLEVITPSRAHELLATKERPDRSVVPTHVQRLADDMRLGLWVVNGESIKINADGEVIDGQHRLHACIKADKPFESMVVTDLASEDEVQYTTDSGRKRSISDALRIQGESYVNELAGAVGQQWRFLTDRMSLTQGPSVPVGLKLFSRFAGDESGPGLRHSAGEISRLRHQARVHISGTLGTWGHYVFGEIERRQGVDEGANQEFWQGLYLGTDLVEDDPRLHLRDRFIDHHNPLKGTKRMGRGEMVALTIKAWNAFSDGRLLSTHKLRWRQVGPQREAFPEISGQDCLDDWFRIRL